MATIKSYSDLQQSKKLAEVLPIESADMSYSFDFDSEIYEISTTSYKSWVVPKYAQPDDGFGQVIPCWSLAALLSVLPFHLIVSNQRYAFSMHKGLNKDGETYVLRYNVFNTDVCLYITDYYDNPVDACVAMIEKLNELKML